MVAAGQRDQARAAFLMALKLDPDFVEAWFNLANLAKTQGQRDIARQYLQKAIALDCAYADAIYNFASLEFEDGRLAEARSLWARYLELDADSEWARNAAKGIHYADLHLRSGMPAG